MANIITDLQPLFCSRASIEHAQQMMTNKSDMDCQLRLRFADGSEAVLSISRTDIENILTAHKTSVETEISNLLDGDGE